jgi:5-formyltetrahydrofolate cyclo-ligase
MPPSPAQAASAERRLLALPELASARTVSLYAALLDEIPTRALAAALRRRGARVALPRVVGEDLELRESDDAQPLVRGAAGVLEPAPEALAIPADAVDVFVVPGLLFDRAGRRLGRGGGHFDRLLARARPDALRVGVCTAERLVRELPEDPWDVRVHRIVTDQETLCVGEPARGAGGAR